MRRWWLSSILLIVSWGLPVQAIVLVWNPSPGATGYRLHYGTGSGMYQEIIDTQAFTHASVGGLAPGYTYFFAATAYNADGESGYSNEVSTVIGYPVPVVTITHPVNGDTVPRHELVAIEAEAIAPAGVVIVIFLVNGDETCAVQVPPYRCDWFTPAANKRVYQLQARAVDVLGHVGVSPLVEVIAQ